MSRGVAHPTSQPNLQRVQPNSVRRYNLDGLLEVRIYAATLAVEEYSPVMATNPRQSFFIYISIRDVNLRCFNGLTGVLRLLRLVLKQ
jgi:hypothetical protein